MSPRFSVAPFAACLFALSGACGGDDAQPNDGGETVGGDSGGSQSTEVATASDSALDSQAGETEAGTEVDVATAVNTAEVDAATGTGPDSTQDAPDMSAPEPRLVASPVVVDFGPADDQWAPIPGMIRTKQVVLFNVGGTAVAFAGIRLSGNPAFHLKIGSERYDVTPDSAEQGTVFATPITIPPGGWQHVAVEYEEADAEDARGQVVFLTDDPASPDGLVVRLFANSTGPCIRVKPSHVDFGAKAVGQLSAVQVEIANCGAELLQLNAAELSEDGGGAFAVHTDQIGAMPLALSGHESAFLPVSYQPTRLAAQAGASQIVEDRGILHITSSAYLDGIDVPLTGFATDGSCPTAAIDVDGDAAASPGTLQLDGARSASAIGAISRYEWTVIAPPGATATFSPSNTVAAPVLHYVYGVGDYHVRLKVWDPLNTPSCAEAEYSIEFDPVGGRDPSVPSEGIFVEIVWHNPADLNEFDEGDGLGSDLDLHFLHPNAQGKYFDSIFDVFYLNPSPNWAGFGTADDPLLSREDTDGAGPEAVTLMKPQAESQYHAGVNYWNDWGYGPAYVSLRVAVDGVIRFSSGNVKLIDGDMWDACTIDWPSGQVTGLKNADGQPVITPGFAGENWL